MTPDELIDLGSDLTRGIAPSPSGPIRSSADEPELGPPMPELPGWWPEPGGSSSYPAPGPFDRLCPRCGSPSLEIVYGMFTPASFRALHEARQAPGGCVMFPDSPRWTCQNCDNRWG